MKLFGRSEKKESENYEKKYLARYKKQQKSKQKNNISKNKKDVEIESDEKITSINLTESSLIFALTASTSIVGCVISLLKLHIHLFLS